MNTIKLSALAEIRSDSRSQIRDMIKIKDPALTCQPPLITLYFRPGYYITQSVSKPATKLPPWSPKKDKLCSDVRSHVAMKRKDKERVSRPYLTNEELEYNSPN